MASSASLYFSSILLFLFLLSGSILQVDGLEAGINYGRIADNLPPPAKVAQLLQSIGIHRVKLYDADPNVLTAFANTDIEVIIGLGDEPFTNLTNPANAQSWIQSNVVPYINQTKITGIVVGNEVLGANTDLASYLYPAMDGVHTALTALGLSNQVYVTTAHSAAILANSFPPSSGSFKPELGTTLQSILDFHSKTKSPFYFNAYPFFAYKSDPQNVPLDYVIFRPNQGIDDTATNLHYDNMLHAELDAVYAAMKLLGYTDVDIVVSETGWPSKGDADEAGASVENAATYNGNLLQRVEKKEGTPGRPSVPISAYVFALFNENMKPGPNSERNFGLFYPDTSPVYNVGLRNGQLQSGQSQNGQSQIGQLQDGQLQSGQFQSSSGNPKTSYVDLLTCAFCSSVLTTFLIFA